MPASSDPRAGQRPGPEPLLPAPYRSPWRQLGESLGAVVADLGLGLRRLLRLNRQGELPIPPFWSRGLAALFWPLLLGLGLTLLVVGGLWLGVRSPLEPEQVVLSSLVPLPVSPPAAEPAADPAADPATEQPPATEPAAPAVDAPAGDGLQVLLAQSEAAGLLAAVGADPSLGLLRFTLDTDFEALVLPERQLQADRWLAWARELGYEHLELRDGRGRLAAREALVGDGMILLTSRPPS